MRVFKSARHRRIAILGLAALALVIGSVYLTARTYAPFIFSPVELRAVVADLGPLAPIAYITVHTIQVVLMAIPGYAIAVAGGYLFGPTAGTAYTMIGVTLGSVIAFLVARLWGRSVVERLLHGEALERFDTFAKTAGIPGLFLFILIPVLPEDVISFIAGLTYFRLSVFAGLMFLGRLPAAAVAVLAGDGFAAGHLVEGGLWLATLVVAIAVTYYRREAIMDRLESY